MSSSLPTLLALAAAATLAAGYALTKRLVHLHRARSLIGPLFALNALAVAPAAPFVDWAWSWRIVGLHAASSLLLVVGAAAVFHLLPRGTAAGVATAQAVSPVPAVVFGALLLPDVLSWTQALVAVVVAAGLLMAIAGTFEQVARARASAILLLAASAQGLLAVLTKMLANEGVQFVPIYLVRTAVAAAIWVAIAPPRGLSARSVPALALRASFITASFACSVAAIERGSPVTVQTFAATAPLLLVVGEVVVRRRRPAPRIVLAAVVVLAGAIATVSMS